MIETRSGFGTFEFMISKWFRTGLGRDASPQFRALDLRVVARLRPSPTTISPNGYLALIAAG